MGARMYDPELGRFISPDSIIPNPANPQSLNRYSYVYNSPLKFHDPSGHTPAWVDFLVGATYQVANDMSFGAFNAALSLTVDAFWDTRQSESFHEGQQVGRNLSQAIGGTLMINGVATAAAGAAAMGPTAGLAAATTGPTAGGSVVVGEVALSAEAAMVIGGTAQAAYGLGIIAYTKLNPLPDRENTQQGGRPGSNTAQNKQFRGAVRKIEKQLDRRLSYDEIRQLHDALHHLENPGYWDIVDEGLNLFDMGGN